MARGNDTATVTDLLRRREGLYHGLLVEADRQLALVGSPVEAETERVIRVRQELLDAIQKIDTEISARCGGEENGPSPAIRGLLDEYAGRRKRLTEKILEKDSLAIALAHGRIEDIRRDLGGLSRGRTALQGYESGL